MSKNKVLFYSIKRIGLYLLLACFSMSSTSEEEYLPELGDTSSSAISLASEYELGRLWIAQLRRSTPELNDPIAQDYLEHLIYRLSEYSQLQDKRLEIVLIDQKNINAFAAPGGIIGVAAGLIFHAETEGQLVSVLSHELAHLSQRHFARRIQRQEDRGLANALIILASIAVAAASTPEAALAGQQVLAQQALSYSRSNEQEADRIGFLNLVSAGYNPQSMPRMFEKLQSLNRMSGSTELEFLRSHPLTKKRISDSKIRANEIKGSNYKDSLEYHLVRTRTLVHFSKLPRQAVALLKQNLRKAKTKREKIIAGYGLALALSKDNKHSGALEMARENLNLDPENLILQTALLEVHINARNNLEATALGKQLLEINPNNYPLSMLYARALLNQSDFEKSEEILKKLSLRRKSDPQVWYWLAEVQGLSKNILGLHQSRSEYFYVTGNYNQAIQHLRYALELAGNNFQLNESLRTKIENIHLTVEALKELT